MLNKNSIAAFALFLAIPLSAGAQDGTTTEKKYKLEYKFTKGKVDKYRLRISVKSSGMMSLGIKGALTMDQTGGSFDKDKQVGQVVQEIKTVKLELDMAGSKQDYDTEKGGGGEGNMLKNAANALIGKSTLDLKPNGKVEKSKSDKKEGNNPLKSALGAKHIPYDILRLPGKELKVGDTWTHTAEEKTKDSMGAESTLKITYTYTLKRVQNKEGDDIATITMKIKPGLEKMPGGMGGTVTKQEGKGSASFNITKGHLRSCNYTVKMEGKSDFGEGEDAKSYSKQSFNLRRLKKDTPKESK
jgi:hypothetical protein